MSFYRPPILVCDGCDADEFFGAHNVTDTRKNAKEQGWTKKGTKDFCPKCSALQRGHRYLGEE